MKRILLVICVVLLSGCREQVGLKELGLVAGLGIDKIEDGYLLTAQVVNPNAIGGNDSNALPIYSVSAEGETLYEAFQKIDNQSIHALYLAHLHVIVIDETTAEEGLNPILDFALRHTEIRPDINILVAYEETSQDILNVLIPNDPIPVSQLDIYVSMVKSHTGRLGSYNLYDTVKSVNKTGLDTVLNAASIDREPRPDNDSEDEDDSEDQQDKMDVASSTDNISKILPESNLEIKHFAVFNDDKLVGYLDDTEIQLYNILQNKDKYYILKIKVEDDYYVSMEANRVNTKIHTQVADRKVLINCEVTGILTENRYPMDLSAGHNVEILEEYFSEQLKKDLLALIEKTQTEVKADIFRIGGHAYNWENENWFNVKGHWDEIYPTLDFEVNVDVVIESIGDIENLYE